MLVTLGHNLRDGAILPEYEAFGWAIIEIAHQRYSCASVWIEPVIAAPSPTMNSRRCMLNPRN
jgi:hypothetical protein